MLSKIRLKAGPSLGTRLLEIDATPVTIFVGPNNSGKSLALQEIEVATQVGVLQLQFKVISEIQFAVPTSETAAEHLERIRVPGAPDAPRGQMNIKWGQRTQTVHEDELRRALANPPAHAEYFAQHFAQFHRIRLDGLNRLSLTNSAPMGNFSVPPATPLQAIWRDNEKRREWRRIIQRAFGFFPALDATQIPQLHIKASAIEPSEDDERTFKQSAVEFHANSLPMASYSDGVRAFTGIMLQIMAGEPELILIDEPEAFLHPSLCYRLGWEISKYLTKAAQGKSRPPRQLIVSTHSPDFIMGCVQTKAATNIVRLTYDAGIGTARLLPHADLIQLMRKPALRSVNALSGLFYNAVIVTEADADRAFYQETNSRLVDFKPEWGTENCLFLNSNGKATIPDIVKPLRDIGVPTALIVDIDVLKDGGSVWSKFMDACKVPALDKPSFDASRSNVLAALNATGKNCKIDGGIDLLTPADRQAASNFLERLAEYGMFVLPRGEIERWLPALAVSRAKHTWLRDIFEKLGEDPSDTSYVKPSTDDVWEFLSKVKSWLASPTRKGL